MGGSVRRQQSVQVFRGRFRIAQMELHRLAFLHHVADGDGSGGAVGPEQIPNKKIPSLEPVSMFVDHDTDMERPMGAASVFFRQRFEDRL
jgi:hypothetical protein